MSPSELRGAIRMLESIIEIGEEEGSETVDLDDIRELLKTYKKRAGIAE